MILVGCTLVAGTATSQCLSVPHDYITARVMLTATKNVPTVLGLLTVFVAYVVFRATTDIPRLVSPQGCRMSWMSPSYVLQAEFNTSWTPLSSRYSLLLYREVGWESNQVRPNVASVNGAHEL